MLAMANASRAQLLQLGNAKSLPQFFIAALYTSLSRPILVDAKLVSVPGYTPIVIFPAQMKVRRPTTTQTTEAMMPSRYQLIRRIDCRPAIGVLLN
jgi:hypothetical protein